MVDEFWTKDFEDSLDNDEWEMELFDQLYEMKYHLRDERHNAYDDLMEKLHEILDFYRVETFQYDTSVIKFLDKDEKRNQVCEFIHYANYKLDQLLDYHINSTISLKDKFVKSINDNHSESHLYQVNEEDIFPPESSQITTLIKQNSKAYIPFEKMDVVLCCCQRQFHLKSLLHHMNHKSVQCRKFLTSTESNLLDMKITKYQKKVE